MSASKLLPKGWSFITTIPGGKTLRVEKERPGYDPWHYTILTDHPLYPFLDELRRHLEAIDLLSITEYTRRDILALVKLIHPDTSRLPQGYEDTARLMIAQLRLDIYQKLVQEGLIQVREETRATADGIVGITYKPVIRVESEDDGSITVVVQKKAPQLTGPLYEGNVLTKAEIARAYRESYVAHETRFSPEDYAFAQNIERRVLAKVREVSDTAFENMEARDGTGTA